MTHQLSAAAAFTACLMHSVTPVFAQDCTRDAMLVFDGSASMAAPGPDHDGAPRIEDARAAMTEAIPQIAPVRRLGLIVYGPGPENSCEGVNLRLRPTANAAEPLLDIIALVDPNGPTPLTEAVRAAADVLDHQNTPGIVVLITDGNDTCDGAPCSLGAQLATQGANLTVHVIGFRVNTDRFGLGQPNPSGYPDGVSGAKCIAEQTGGLYIPTTSIQDLSDALRITLGCSVVGSIPAHSGETGRKQS